MEKYTNRQAAGQQLAIELQAYAKLPNAIVLALPRGGVPVAYEVAKALSLPLDVFLVRKLGVPGYEELAMGAIAMGGAQVLNPNVIAEQRISDATLAEVIAAETQELKRRELAYRGNRSSLDLNNKVIILIDDGIATGATMRVAVKALRQLQPSSIIMAVPVAETTTCDKMNLLVDKFICPLRLRYFYAVGAHYEDFSQTSDSEVTDLLAQADKELKHDSF